jgi:hypothetical protein
MGKFKYSGDINVEHGGVWYKLNRKDWDSYGYCSAIRVTPCSDGGAQDNAWWVEELTVLKPEKESELKSILETCGWFIDPETGDIVSTYRADTVAKKGTAAFRWAIADSCVGYGRYDIINSETVQIGKKPEGKRPYWEQAEPSIILRANSSLERYVRNNFLKGL